MRKLILKIADRLEGYTDKDIYAHIEKALEIAMEDYDEAQRHASESSDVKKFNKQRDDWYELQQGLNLTNELAIAGKLARLKVYDTELARRVACELLTSHSCVFQVEPLPDGEYEITTKDEGILEQVLEELNLDPDVFDIEKMVTECGSYLEIGGEPEEEEEKIDKETLDKSDTPGNVMDSEEVLAPHILYEHLHKCLKLIARDNRFTVRAKWRKSNEDLNHLNNLAGLLNDDEKEILCAWQWLEGDEVSKLITKYKIEPLHIFLDRAFDDDDYHELFYH